MRFACEKDVTHVDDLKDFVGTEDIGDYSFVEEDVTKDKVTILKFTRTAKPIKKKKQKLK